VYGIVKQSGGYIEVVSAPGQGACFSIDFPRVFQPVAAPARQVAEQELRGSQTILVVEDEPGVLNLVVHILRRHGFEVLETTDPEEGVLLFEQHGERIDMLLTDVVMPFMSGPALAEVLSRKKPGLKVLFMSGHTDNRLTLQSKLEQGVQFLPKPFTSDTLTRKVWDTLTAPASQGDPAAAPSGGSN
jgi:DNA-binding NtrC family response regulator